MIEYNMVANKKTTKTQKQSLEKELTTRTNKTLLLQETVEMAKSVTLKDIQDEVRELRILYKEMLDRILPSAEPTKVERKAISERDEIVHERELMKALGIHRRN